MVARKPVLLVVFAVAGVSFVAKADPPAGETSAQSQPAKPPLPFRGSAISYSHSITALTAVPSAEPYYNPTWGHRLGLFPEWHFNDQLFVRGKLYLSQEFTDSDSDTYNHEVELSDLLLDVGVTGFTERRTGLRLGADLRLGLPTSKISLAQTRILSLGPSLSLSRDFQLLHGLKVAYSVRFTYRFNRFTTRQNNGPTIASCGDARSAECVDFVGTGVRNPNFDLAHGPTISFAPLERLSFDAFFLYQHLWLYPLAPVTGALAGLPSLNDTGPDVRNLAIFALSASWELFRPVGITIGSFTVTSLPAPDGSYLFPLFNRNTTLYLDATFDIEALASSFL